MADQKGKRNCTRYDLEAIITWSYFNTTNFFNAKLVNYSESGLCFESESGIKPGAGIFIRLEKLLPNPAGIKLHQGFRTVTLGEARWCREAGDVGSRKYNIGIRYYEPYYQFPNFGLFRSATQIISDAGWVKTAQFGLENKNFLICKEKRLDDFCTGGCLP